MRKKHIKIIKAELGAKSQREINEQKEKQKI